MLEAQEIGAANGCERCGSSNEHVSCPVCDGRGCISSREIAEKLGLREHLDLVSLDAEGIARAVDKKVVETIRLAKESERALASQQFETERNRVRESERHALEAARELKTQIVQLQKALAEADVRLKAAEDASSRRISHPASLGRSAERSFAAIVGAQPDFRVSEKLARNGDYEVWFSVRGHEALEPVLVDVKRDSAALMKSSVTRLARDCRERGRPIGVLVADCVDEIHERFGPKRILRDGDETILLTSVSDFCTDMRLLAEYWELLLRARATDDKPLVSVLASLHDDLSTALLDIEEVANGVAGRLEQQAEILRVQLVGKLCLRVTELLAKAQAKFSSRKSSKGKQ